MLCITHVGLYCSLSLQGGVIARALFTLPEFHHSLVHTIITQATPHVSPVVGADKHLVDFYAAVNKVIYQPIPAEDLNSWPSSGNNHWLTSKVVDQGFAMGMLVYQV